MAKKVFIFESEFNQKRLGSNTNSTLKIGDKVTIKGLSYVLTRIEIDKSEPEELSDIYPISTDDYINMMYFS